MHYITTMRTTLNLDQDVAEAARAIADRDARTLGEVVSDLARQSLQSNQSPHKRNELGLPLLPSRGRRKFVTLDMVNRLRDEAP